MILTKEFLETNPLFIAEVGQNHQGDLECIFEYIKTFALAGANAIKFQKRDNRFLFDSSKYDAPYDHENAFGSTYGQHREFLELKPEWLPEIKAACEAENVLFMCTPFDEPSLELLIKNGVDILKVASFDLGNIPLLDKMASTGKPIVMSIGGGRAHQIEASINALEQASEKAILHCVSEYPCPPERLGLDNIETLISLYPDIPIGLSDHFNGTLSGPLGYMKGARIFEKHVTLNRAWKGTDHSFALEYTGFRKFVRDIQRVPLMNTPKNTSNLGREAVFKKLGKSIVANVQIKEGETINLSNITGRIIGTEGVPVRQSADMIGKKTSRAFKKYEPIFFDDLV